MKRLNLHRKGCSQAILSSGLRLLERLVGTIFLTSFIALCWTSGLEAGNGFSTDLTNLSLEELMDIEVTSVSKKSQKISNSSAAVFVVTQQDIRRSGVTNIPDALRMVPGLEVARMDASKWAVTSRGFNGRFANKLLVMIDGRSIYTALMSGVFWEYHYLPLEDIERIEVIRGPGAALWGANAVNGVINIITKDAKNTEGNLLTLGIGTEERSFTGVRFGTELGEESSLRIYAKHFNRDNAVYASGREANDGANGLRGGFRADGDLSGNDSLTVQGDIYDGEAAQTFVLATPPSLTTPYMQNVDEDTDISGGNLLVRWKHTFSKSSDMSTQVYYDLTERNDLVFNEKQDTIDIDIQHRFALSERHEIVWGLGYRFISEDTRGSFYLSLYPDRSDDNMFSSFVQDEVKIVEDQLALTFGIKLEHNDYTGMEVQPSLRLLWTPDKLHSVWAALSRAVRTPSGVDHYMWLNREWHGTSSPILVSVIGNEDYKSEKVIAYELGYRFRLLKGLSLDNTVFYNVYKDLRTVEPSILEKYPLYSVYHMIAENKMDGVSYGAELSADWRLSDWWRLQAAYTYLNMQLDLDSDSKDFTFSDADGESPHHQFSIRSSTDLPGEVEFDLWARYVDYLPNINIGSYVTLDARLGWKPVDNIDLSIVGQNILDSHHPEFKPEVIDTLPTEVERSVYGKITWLF